MYVWQYVSDSYYQLSAVGVYWYQYVVWYMIPYTDNSIDFRTATSLKVDNFVCYFVSCNMGIVQHSLSRQCFNWHVLFGSAQCLQPEEVSILFMDKYTYKKY